MAEIFDFTVAPQDTNPRWPEGTLLIPQINNSARDGEAIIARWYQDTRGTLTATGGPVSYAVTISQTITSLIDGLTLSLVLPVTCGDNPTLNVNGTGARNMVSSAGTNILEDNMLVGAVYDLVYQNSEWRVKNAQNRRHSELRLQPSDGGLTQFDSRSRLQTGTFHQFNGFSRNSADETVKYAEMLFGVLSATDGAEQGRIDLNVLQNGSNLRHLTLQGQRASFFDAPFPANNNEIALPTGAAILVGGANILAGAGPKNIVDITSSGTYDKPDTLFGAIVMICGGGGGGGRGTTSQVLAGGGGSGGFCMSAFAAADIPDSVTVTVGGAGARSTAQGVNGTAGGSSQFLSMVAGGGGGGSAGGGGGAGGTASGGQLNVPGEEGGVGGAADADTFDSVSGAAGPLFGLGAGGYGRAFATGAAARAGRAGRVIVVEF